MLNQVLTHANRDLSLALIPQYICHFVLGSGFDVETHGLAI